ncbi:MAG TPA: thiamine-phosphate kinase [Dehalococcoidales bacterium]|nr:thiamine-phosphate kinase [Dehalococcoidales bacterium]
MKVSKLGEFGLIDLIAKMIADAKVDRLSADQPLIGIGDDCAAWKPSGGLELGTVDTMFEGVHFNTGTTPWRGLGWKSLTINLSDIAAMGGVPEYALVALALPEDTDVADITSLYDGIIEAAKETHTAIVGGNISRAPQISVTITVIGHTTGNSLLRRDAARPGDVIAVTGDIGSAAGGLEMLSQGLKLKSEPSEYLKQAFLRPTARLAEGQILLKLGVKSAIDISDGLVSDLRHICEQSKLSARIFAGKLPIHPLLSGSFGEKALGLALAGGEDYELLFTATQEVVNKVKTELKCPVTAVGEIVAGEPGKIDLIDAVGKTVKTGKSGWRHF